MFSLVRPRPRRRRLRPSGEKSSRSAHAGGSHGFSDSAAVRPAAAQERNSATNPARGRAVTPATSANIDDDAASPRATPKIAPSNAIDEAQADLRESTRAAATR